MHHVHQSGQLHNLVASKGARGERTMAAVFAAGSLVGVAVV